MIVAAMLIAGLAVAAMGLSALVVTLLFRLLQRLDGPPVADHGPAWWPEFERDFADHVARLDEWTETDGW